MKGQILEISPQSGLGVIAGEDAIVMNFPSRSGKRQVFLCVVKTWILRWLTVK